MKQTSFSDVEFANKKKPTRRERFLAENEAATPWPALVAALLPYYPAGDGRGRPPIGLERMLRMYIAQQCLGLSDEGIEDAIYDIVPVRNFVGVDLTHDSAPDATTLLKFRRLLEEGKRRLWLPESWNQIMEQGEAGFEPLTGRCGEHMKKIPCLVAARR